MKVQQVIFERTKYIATVRSDVETNFTFYLLIICLFILLEQDAGPPQLGGP
jgi:hypothetical protein